MSASSTESGNSPSEDQAPDSINVPKEGQQESGQNQDQKVPVAALAKERAEKRAAREEADNARGELQRLKEANPDIDLNQLSKVVAELASQTANAAVEEFTAPLKKEVEHYKMATEFGLNKAQAEAVEAVRSEVSGLTPERAIALLKLEKPELFPSTGAARPADPSSLTAPGRTGNSPYATSAPTSNYERDVGEALSKGDRAAAQKIAQAEFVRRANSIFGKR